MFDIEKAIKHDIKDELSKIYDEQIEEKKKELENILNDNKARLIDYIMNNLKLIWSNENNEFELTIRYEEKTGATND